MVAKHKLKKTKKKNPTRHPRNSHQTSNTCGIFSLKIYMTSAWQNVFSLWVTIHKGQHSWSQSPPPPTWSNAAFSWCSFWENNLRVLLVSLSFVPLAAESFKGWLAGWLIDSRPNATRHENTIKWNVSCQSSPFRKFRKVAANPWNCVVSATGTYISLWTPASCRLLSSQANNIESKYSQQTTSIALRQIPLAIPRLYKERC